MESSIERGIRGCGLGSSIKGVVRGVAWNPKLMVGFGGVSCNSALIGGVDWSPALKVELVGVAWVPH